MYKCYHFCTRDFYNELMSSGKLFASSAKLPKGEWLPEDYVKHYVFNMKKINYGLGMFFAWTNPSYKNPIEYNDTGEYVLIELDVPEDYITKTHYENWCSLGMDLYESNGNLQATDDLCKSLGLKNGLKDSYDCIYAIDKLDEIQILMPCIDTEWIKSVKYCDNRNR